MDKGCRNAHPFPGFFSKIFLRKNLPFTYLELQSQVTPYFSEKLKIFFVLLRDDLFLLTEEKVSSLIPTARNQMHTLNLKKFYPFTYLELGSRNATCFHKKFEKYFVRLWDSLFYLPKKSFHLFGI